MTDDILQKIRSRGYWRINFQPLQIEKLNSLAECLNVVQKSKVSLRGWDYPHFPRKQDENEGLYPSNEFYVAWSNWGANKEYWRIYKSQQFIMLRALREDWYEEDGWYSELAAQIKPNTVLSVMGSLVYELTEVMEFLSRLGQNGLYKQGVKVNISLHNTKQRQLRIDDRNRMPFVYPRITNAQEIKITDELSIEEVFSGSYELANKYILKIMDSFGFNPEPNSVMADQKKINH